MHGCTSIIINSFHLFLIFSLYVYMHFVYYLNFCLSFLNKVFLLLLRSIISLIQHIPLSAYHLNSDTNYLVSQWPFTFDLLPCLPITLSHNYQQTLYVTTKNNAKVENRANIITWILILFIKFPTRSDLNNKKLGYRLYIYVSYYFEFWSSNTCFSYPKWELGDKVLRKRKMMMNTRDNINTLASVHSLML